MANMRRYHTDPEYRAKQLEAAKQARLRKIAADPVGHRAKEAAIRRKRIDNWLQWGYKRSEIPGQHSDSHGGKQSKNCKTRLCAGARLRDRQAGRSGTLKPSDLFWPTHCPVLGIELIYGCDREAGHPANATLDRWDNNLGYEPGNVYVVSWRANQLKSNGTPDELQAVADYARNGIWKAA